jgi:hypothetical protein
MHPDRPVGQLATNGVPVARHKVNNEFMGLQLATERIHVGSVPGTSRDLSRGFLGLNMRWLNILSTK